MVPAHDGSRPSNTLVRPLARSPGHDEARAGSTERRLRGSAGAEQVSPVKELQEIGHRKLPRHSGRQFGTPVRPRRAERARVVIKETDQHLPSNAAPDLASPRLVMQEPLETPRGRGRAAPGGPRV